MRVTALMLQRSVVCVVTFGLLCCVAGCQQYGTVSPRAYEFANALYSICNRQDASRLDSTESLISEAVESGELPGSEEKWLLAIVDSARSGEWTSAAQDARTMMEDQIH